MSWLLQAPDFIPAVGVTQVEPWTALVPEMSSYYKGRLYNMLNLKKKKPTRMVRVHRAVIKSKVDYFEESMSYSQPELYADFLILCSEYIFFFNLLTIIYANKLYSNKIRRFVDALL